MNNTIYYYFLPVHDKLHSYSPHVCHYEVIRYRLSETETVFSVPTARESFYSERVLLLQDTHCH